MKQLNPGKIKDRIMKIAYETKCSHAASAMSCVNLLCDIYNKWPDAIVVLSKGHGALALYVCLNELGRLPNDILKTYHKNGGLSVHSTLDQKIGVMASTGSLGHGLPIGIGYAIGYPDRVTAVVLSDGELEEGSTLESLQIISRLGLKNILPIVDKNDCQGFKTNEGLVEPLIRNYYSIKGQGFGEQYEGKIESHYQVISDDIYKTWKKNGPKIEKDRVTLLKEYEKKIAKQ